MRQVVAAFPDDIENVHDFWFNERTYDDLLCYAGIRFFIRADSAGQECHTQVGDDRLDHQVALAGFENDFWLKADFFAVLDDFIMEIEIVTVQYERFIGQLLQGNCFFFGEDIVSVDDYVHRILGQEERFEIFFLSAGCR